MINVLVSLTVPSPSTNLSSNLAKVSLLNRVVDVDRSDLRADDSQKSRMRLKKRRLTSVDGIRKALDCLPNG